MADIQPTDQFLVNRSDFTQTIDHADLMASLQDTDLMLINRSDTTYTITGEDLKDSLKPELTLTVVLSTYDAEVGGEITATGVAGGGTPPFTYVYQWQKAGVNIAGATNQKYTPVLADVGSKLKCVVTATDDDGDDITAASLETNDVVEPAAPPAVSGATLAGGPGFSGKTYTTTLQGYDPGVPTATQGLKAKVTGALSVPGETSAITSVDPVGGGTTLTLTDDTNLRNGAFQIGDTVHQSDDEAITGTVTGIDPDVPSMSLSGATAGWTVGETAINNVANPVTIKPLTSDITAKELTTLTFSDDTDLGEFVASDDVYQDSGYTPQTSAITGVNDTDPSAVVLTLTDDTDLENLRVGDTLNQVGGHSTTLTDEDIPYYYDEDETEFLDPPLSTCQTIQYQNFFNSNVNDSNKNGNKGFYFNTFDDFITFGYTGFTAGEKISFVMGTASAGAEVNDLYALVSGDITENGQNIKFYDGVSGLNKNQLPKSLLQITATQATGTVTFKSAPFNGNPGNGPSAFFLQYYESSASGTVSAISGNSVTLINVNDGWEAGRTAQGPDTTPGTGTVGSVDVAAKTMTLSTSDETPPKRWIANGGRKVTMDEKPAVQSTAFLKFSGTQVTGLTSADPGYKPADPSLQLTFTDPSPTGGTWDQELPAGTYMQTRVLATNDSGTADTGWSNRAVGRGLSPSADMQEAYLEASARLLTHKNRADYHQGQLALQARADIRINIAQEMGVTVEELNDLLDENYQTQET